MQAKLIVLEGIDGSGKSTQFSTLCEALSSEEIDFNRLVFPQYESESSALVRMYLGGELSSSAEEVNPFAASTFFAVDRYASYMTTWGNQYKNGTLLLSDRYTTSNAIHQGSKLFGDEREEFFRWLYEFEFERMELPAPDLVLYMDISLEASMAHISSRSRDTGQKVDIHEKDSAFLAGSLEAGSDAADYFGWKRIRCIDESGDMRRPEDIHQDILKLVKEVI